MFDVFYIGTKPGLFAHERPADSIQHACEQSRTRYCWIVNYLSDYTGFDFLWEPPPWQADQRHAWASQHQKDSGTYLVPRQGFVDTNYHRFPIIQRLPSNDLWAIPPGVDVDGFDFSWHPDPTDPPMTYQFGTQHQRTGGPIYHVPDATDTKFINNSIVTKWCCDDFWNVPDGLDLTEFDFTWHPDHRDPPYIYHFGTQHQATGGPIYHVPGATESKYISVQRARKISRDSHWVVPDNMNIDAFDWTWHPDAREQPYRYQFPTQWNRAGGPEYCVPGSTEIKFVGVQVARMLPTDRNWTIPEGIDVNSFDFSWTPDPTEPPYIYEFGTQWQKTGGPCYMVLGATERKYIIQPRAVRTTRDDCWQTPPGIENFDYTWHPDATEQPYIYEFGTQWQKTGGPRYVMPGATEVKYVPAPRAERIISDDCWEIPDGADVETFDWTWHPDATEQPYIYQFGTQHQRTGGPRYLVSGATDVKYVDQIRIKTQRVATTIIEIDHMDGNAGQIPGTTRTSRYFDNYLDTLRRIAKNIDREHEFVWICSSICDYQDFDFSWHPEQWQATMLHVFASDGEKFGDTFFMHVPTFQYRSENTKLLEWYDVNFVEGLSVPRRSLPVIRHDKDTHVDAIKSATWAGPLAVFTTPDVNVQVIPPVPLWREKTKTVVPLTPGASAVVIPKVAVPAIRIQVYDYEYIDKTHRHGIDPPLDIVFISNGEPNAESNWQWLQHWTQDRANRVHRVDGVNGRAAAYHAAAQASVTPWFFAVFAKLEVDNTFDWTWQPDRLQQPKHYIFHAQNPCNGLVYGHQAMIAYNKKLVLANPGRGLDFTLDDEHEVVPLMSGIARYNLTAWSAWRTAFREVIKLRASLPDVESEYRINRWCVNGGGDNAQWSAAGAEDALEYYDEVHGDFAELRKSYEWAWLASYALMRRNLTPNQ